MHRILFLHHSVGRYLIRDGEVRARLAAGSPRLELWDHDYNKFGLTNGDGEPVGRAFPLPDDDTDPGGFLRLFSSSDPDAQNAREQALEFDVIAMKSCYPNSAIGDDAELERIRETYRALLAALAGIPERQFVLLTSPPLAPLRTNAAQARRARSLAGWLAGPAAVETANVRVFDLFDRLAQPAHAAQANRLRRQYRRRLPVDSHPNRQAGREVAPALITVLQEAAAAVHDHGGVSSP